MHALPLSELRANISATLDLVECGETVRITRHGRPVADLVPVTLAHASTRVRTVEQELGRGASEPFLDSGAPTTSKAPA